MSHDNRKRLLIGAAGLVGLLIVVLAAAPSFVDVNAYKPEILAQVKRATGREAAIDGPIRLSLLPTPSVALDDVRLFNLPGSKNPDMVEVKSVTVRPSLLALLMGNIEVAEVTLVEPKIVLEINAEGKPNWELTPSVAEARPVAARPASPKPLSLGRLTVANGTLIFSDSKAGLSAAAEKADFTASIGSIDGPYSLAGGATINGSPLTIDLTVSAKGAAGHTVDVALTAGGGRLSYKGTMSELGPAARLSGTAAASADNLVAFAETLARIAGQPKPNLPPLLAGKFRFDGPVELSPTSAVAKDFKLVLGEDAGSGSLTLTLAPALAVEARFAAHRLDLDRWLASLPLPELVTPPPVTISATPSVTPAGATQSPAVGWLAALNAKLALEVGELIYNRKPVRDVALELEARGGAVAVPKFTATLPGELAVQARSTFAGDPARPTVSGDFSLSAPKLRETLTWLAIDVSSIPADKLRQLGIKGRMGSSNGNVEVSQAVFDLDELKGSGGIVVRFTVPLSIVTHVELGTLDLDSYMPPPGPTPAAAASAVESVTPILALLGPSIGLKLKVARIDYRGDAITGIDIDVARNAGTLTMNELRVASLAGAHIALRGAVAGYWTDRPRADVAFDFDVPDMERVLKLVGGGGPAGPPAGLGALHLHGGAAGSWDSLTLRDCELDAMGWSVLANGALALPDRADHRKGSYRGSIVVNGQTIEAAIDADLSGSKPVIAADLRTNMLDFGRLGSGGATSRMLPHATADLQSQPFGTPLNSVDGTLKVSVASIGGAPVPLGDAEIAATLKDGVLTVTHFKGGLYGGTISLSGVVDGTRPSLSFDFTGEARDIRLAEMLRHTSGTNEIGSLIRITIDGSASATGVVLRGNGTTVADLRRSLAGGAQLSGHVLARADRFLQILGSAATGAVGGAIDITLGNIMSAFGDRGGVGVGNLLNAISLVLYRYVNHDNALAGHVEITGGVLSDRNLTLQGNRATATIATRTDLASATTDTTINFMLAEEPSAPYLIVTARGPLGSPAFQAVRGAAGDPPGMVRFFQNLPHVPLPSISIPTPHIPTPHIPNIFGR
jgi:uncharacterized protein involved in outer membrane biogenesis